MTDIPKIFRIIIHVGNLAAAVEFYSKLLGIEGRAIRGGRHYYQCGETILALLDPSSGEAAVSTLPDNIYFSVTELETIHARATALDCLSKEDVHGAAAGSIVKRPWGERSFYAVDPFGNCLCFVDANTLFTGQ